MGGNMKCDQRKKAAGFTVIELMIAVGIVGILGTLAIPAFAKYKNKARYSEATQNLGEMFRGEAAMWQQANSLQPVDVAANGTTSMVCVCPAVPSSNILDIGMQLPGKEPNMPDCAGGPSSYGFSDNCSDIGFQPSSPIYFSYHSHSFGQSFGGSAPLFANWAIEDLDGDKTYGFIVELVHERDGELYRSGRYSAGDVAGGGAAVPFAALASAMQGFSNM